MTRTIPESPPKANPLLARLSERSRSFLDRVGSGTTGAAEPGARSPTCPPSSAAPLAPSAASNRATRRRDCRRTRPARTAFRVQGYERELRNEGRRLAKLRRRLAELGVPDAPTPRLIPQRVYQMAQAIIVDRTGAAGRLWLRRMGARTQAGAIARAAFVPLREGEYRFEWGDLRARRVVALGCVLAAMAVPTRRRGTWSYVVRGLPRGALAACLADPFTARRPSVSALAGTHRRGATLESADLGYLRALELAGYCYRQQLPASDVESWERCWPSGYASNRYWLVTEIPERAQAPARVQALCALQALADSVAELGSRLRAVGSTVRRAVRHAARWVSPPQPAAAPP